MLKKDSTTKLPMTGESIEHILEAAVIVNWADLVARGPSGIIHIEYGLATGGTLDYLQVWSSMKKGYWLLACSYWMSGSQHHGSGVRFDNGFESQSLAHILEVVMHHQNLFAPLLNLGWPQGLLQIAMPTETDGKAAAASIENALSRVNSVSSQLPGETEPSLPLMV